MYEKIIKTWIKTASRLKDGVKESKRITEAMYLVSFVTVLEHSNGDKPKYRNFYKKLRLIVSIDRLLNLENNVNYV